MNIQDFHTTDLDVEMTQEQLDKVGKEETSTPYEMYKRKSFNDNYTILWTNPDNTWSFRSVKLI